MGLKFGGWRSLAVALAEEMAACASDGTWGGGLWSADADGAARSHDGELPVITWVPLGRRRRRERGYDQAEILAKAVSRATTLEVRRLLERVVETSPQARKSAGERRVGLQGAFRSLRPAPARVILVDDVLTTGATAAQCGGVLIEAGARQIGVLTAARSLKSAVPARCYNQPRASPGTVVAREIASR